jgi:NAD(P)-dependent dehydrogenase (short-subunit alcohol dehydrogenase family)
MASKAGLNALTKVMTVEWAKYNIQSNAVCPTVIMTPMGEMVWGDPKVGDPMRARIPLGRFGKPVEIADSCCSWPRPRPTSSRDRSSRRRRLYGGIGKDGRRDEDRAHQGRRAAVGRRENFPGWS